MTLSFMIIIFMSYANRCKKIYYLIKVDVGDGLDTQHKQ